jgi:hypothetical protein
MGYNTDFSGKLYFKHPLTQGEEAKLQTFMGEDCREHPEWGRTDLTWIDLKISDEFDGLEWDGSEKTYDLEEKINLILAQMKETFPDFGLTGNLLAQGEDLHDRWILKIVNGVAVREDVGYFEDDKSVIKTELGWAGHFILSNLCQFKRNTLVEYEDTRVVVSTVGQMLMDGRVEALDLKHTYYETMAFYALDNTPAADTTRQIYISSKNKIYEKDVKEAANRMHNGVVEEISGKIISGEI